MDIADFDFHLGEIDLDVTNYIQFAKQRGWRHAIVAESSQILLKGHNHDEVYLADGISVDREISGLVDHLRRNGFGTQFSCQETQHGMAQVIFATGDEVRRFTKIVTDAGFGVSSFHDDDRPYDVLFDKKFCQNFENLVPPSTINCTRGRAIIN